MFHQIHQVEQVSPDRAAVLKTTKHRSVLFGLDREGTVAGFLVFAASENTSQPRFVLRFMQFWQGNTVETGDAFNDITAGNQFLLQGVDVNVATIIVCHASESVSKVREKMLRWSPTYDNKINHETTLAKNVAR
ncbi:MAG: hypothetical protein ABIK07_09255 [Planctomycetota bacterium]